MLAAVLVFAALLKLLNGFPVWERDPEARVKRNRRHCF